jgi:hypothetical protein
MLNLYTRNNFAFVRQISDHTDTGTYYVRVVIRNAYTDAIIDTLNLDSKGNQRYSKIWKIPEDPSGEGFYISVISSVYTDSGYTTKSSTYGDEENTYLVVDRPNNLGGGASFVPSGSSLVRRDVTDIVKKEVADIVPSISKMFEDLFKKSLEKDSIMTAKMNEIYKCVKEIEEKEMPEQEKVELQPVLNAIESLKRDVNAIDTTVDLSPILDVLEADKEDNEATQEDIRMAIKKLKDDVMKVLDTSNDDILKKLKNNLSFASTQIFHPVYKEDDKKEDMAEKEKNDVEEDMAEKEIDLEELAK